MRQAYTYRLCPPAAPPQALEAQLGAACRLYNAALPERRAAYQTSGVALNYDAPAHQLKAIRRAEACALAHFSACQDSLRRGEKTGKAFFRHGKAGQKAGYPRF